MTEENLNEKREVEVPAVTSTQEPSSEEPSTKEASSKDELASPVEADGEDETTYPHGITLLSIIVGLCLAVFLVALDQTIIATAIPRITDDFHSIGDIGWYGSAYFLTTTALQPTFGRIYTIFSVRRDPLPGSFCALPFTLGSAG